MILTIKPLLFLALVAQSYCWAQDFCALTVDLQRFDGQPASRTPVMLKDSSGKVVFEDPVAGPKVEICDFGFGRHTLVVGGCYTTEIPDLVLRLGHPVHLTVRKNECPAEVWRSTCSVYLRIRDQSGTGIGDVDLIWDPAGGPRGRSDRYGRVESFLPLKTSGVAVLYKRGYSTERIELRCNEVRDIEQEITMKSAVP
jgi:hypothetical protein